MEDETYAIEELIFDLANLRAGHRFTRDDFNQTPRLGAVCRRLFGHEDYPGYLELGLPLNYGVGASEIVHSIIENAGEKRKYLSELVRTGDIERALLEWRSLLRQIHYAPEVEWDRWREFKAAAAAMLNKLSNTAIAARFPAMLR